MTPIVAVGAFVFDHEGRVLLVERAKDPGKGLWTVPGGRLEPRETLAQAVAREVREETSLSIEISGFAGWREVLPDPAAGRAGHYLVISFAAHWRGGEVALNDELDDFRWLDPATLDDPAGNHGITTTQGLPDIIQAARKLIGS